MTAAVQGPGMKTAKSTKVISYLTFCFVLTQEGKGPTQVWGDAGCGMGHEI